MENILGFYPASDGDVFGDVESSVSELHIE